MGLLIGWSAPSTLDLMAAGRGCVVNILTDCLVSMLRLLVKRKSGARKKLPDSRISELIAVQPSSSPSAFAGLGNVVEPMRKEAVTMPNRLR